MEKYNKKQYIYIGQYYHIRNKELPRDYKFGVTNSLEQREFSLSRTKSPIKYMILKAWEIPFNVNREKVESLISLIFSEYKYDGCEWYDIDGDLFKDKISTLLKMLSEMIDDVHFTFTEVILDDIKTDTIENILENEIRTGKRLPITNLVVKIDGNLICGDSAKDKFINTFKKVIEYIDPVQISLDFNKVFKMNILDYPEYKRGQCENILDYYLDTHSSTKEKFNIINNLFKIYDINGYVEID